MRFIIFILLLSNLAACSYLKPRHQEYLINKRTPVANSNLITEQELSIQNQQVNSVLNEYRFNENFDDTPIENISLNQVSPDYMEPTDIDYQVGLTEDSNVRHSNPKEVKLHEVQHHKHKKKSYPELSNVPKRKVSEVEHKKLIDNKKQELKKIEQKSKATTKNNTTSAKQSKKEVVSTTRPSKIEIEAKLKQLQSNVASSSVVAKDKLVQKPIETQTQGTAAQSNNTLPKIDLPSTPTVIKALPKSNVGVATNNVQQDPVISQPLNNSTGAPKMPTMANVGVVTKDVQQDPVISQPLNNSTGAPKMPTMANTAPAIKIDPQAVVPSVPALPNTLPQVSPSVPTLPIDAPKSLIPDNTTNKTVKVNKDQSVEVYDSGTVPPPLPPLPPMTPQR
jgi:hypothetical protein